MFQEFKKGVDRQLGHEDYETRYNLGIAYKEMGLIDEAIGEFQLAARDEGRFLDCASMLGICFLEKGMPEVAISWFERGLEAPGRSEEEYLGLRLELARALEVAGNREQALDALMDLRVALEARRHSDPQLEKRMREVSERIMALGGGRK
jgi:tetratricopeptide (TPR) repeat protein